MLVLGINKTDKKPLTNKRIIDDLQHILSIVAVQKASPSGVLEIKAIYPRFMRAKNFIALNITIDLSFGVKKDFPNTLVISDVIDTTKKCEISLATFQPRPRYV